MAVGITVDGLEQLVRGLEAAPRIIVEEMDDALSTILGDVTRDLASYPPPPPQSTYVRTGDLGRGWTEANERLVARANGSVSLRLTNNVEYASLVQGPDQTAVHQGTGWRTAEEVMASREPDILRTGLQAYARAADRIAKGET